MQLLPDLKILHAASAIPFSPGILRVGNMRDALPVGNVLLTAQNIL